VSADETGRPQLSADASKRLTERAEEARRRVAMLELRLAGAERQDRETVKAQLTAQRERLEGLLAALRRIAGRT
jgi:hypothetical protein